VFLKAGGIAHLGAILIGKGAKNQRGDKWPKKHQECENAQPLIDD